MTTPETMNLRQFAKHIGCAANYPGQLKAQGRLVLDAAGRVLVKQSIERIEATRDPSKQGVADRHARQRGAPALTGHAPQAGPGADQATARPVSQQPSQQQSQPPNDEPMDDPAHPDAGLYIYQNAKAKREHWAAEREQTLYRKEAGELMERSQVVAAFAAAGSTLRGKLEAWASVLPPQLQGREEPEIRGLLADQVEVLLGDLAAVFGAMAVEAA